MADLLWLVLTNILSDMFVLVPWDSGTLLSRNNRAFFPGYIFAVDSGYAGAVFSGYVLAGSTFYVPTLLSWDIVTNLLGFISAFLPGDIHANLTWNIHAFLSKNILAYFLWDIAASVLWNVFTYFMRNTALNNLWNISADISRHCSAVVHVESVAKLVDNVVTILPGNINTMLFRSSIDTMLSWFVIAFLCGDIVTQFLMVVAFLTHPLSDRMTFLLVCSEALLLVGG